MALGKSVVKADSLTRGMEITVKLNNKNKPADSAGILASVTNDIHNSLRRYFCAHEIKVPVFLEPKLPKRLKVRPKKK